MYTIWVLYTLLAIGGWYMFCGTLKFTRAIYRHFIRSPINFKKRYGEGWVVITGGAEGIGRAYAEYFAQKGFNILILDHNKALLAATTSSITRRFKVKMSTIEADLASYTFNGDIFEQIKGTIKEK